jgi:hypothetical protein
MLMIVNTDNLVLRPNCLLTKYPLVFITGPATVLHQKILGSDLQDFLKAHGYQVLCPPLSVASTPLRNKILKQWLEQQSYKGYHFILADSVLDELNPILKPLTHSTFTLIEKTMNVRLNHFNPVKTPFLYRLHNALCFIHGSAHVSFNETLPNQSINFCNAFLDLCIELAENERNA